MDKAKNRAASQALEKNRPGATLTKQDIINIKKRTEATMERKNTFSKSAAAMALSKL